MSRHSSSPARVGGNPQALLGDKVLLAAIGMSAAAAVLIGHLCFERALLLVDLDWRPIVFAAGLFAVHHVLFDRLQAVGLGFCCTTEANVWRIALHAVYVVIQTSLEVVLAVAMGRTAREGEELAQPVAAVDQTDGIVLDMGEPQVETPRARALHATLQRMQAVVASVQGSAAQVASTSRVQAVQVFRPARAP